METKQWVMPTQTIKDCYTKSKTTVREMFKHLKNESNNLRLIQKDELNKLYVKYNTKKYLSQDERNYLWNLYFNFILNGYRYNSDNVIVKLQEEENETQSHIAWKILELMNPDSFINENTITQSE